MQETYSEKLASFVASIRYESLPAEVIEYAKICFLDWLGCVFAGKHDPAVEMMAEVAKHSKGIEQSTVIPYGEKNSAIFSAFVNGGAAHALEMDDVHHDSVSHPAAVIIPAVFAVGEREGASGRSIIEALVAGYEVMIRVGEGVGRSHYWFWHNTSTCGTFGAAAGAGKLLGLSVEQWVHALGNAGSQSSGLWEFLKDGANTKLLHTGKAAMNGILAADLAKLNFTGAREIFEGERGFYRATSNDYCLETLVRGLSQKPAGYRILSTSFKFYPSCRHTHSTIDAVLGLAREHDIRWQEVEEVDVHLYSGAINLCGAVELANPYVAKWHIPFIVATALKHGCVDLDSFTNETIRERGLLDFAGRVRLHLSPDLDVLYPAQWPSRVEITLRGGKKVGVSVYYPKGDPQNLPDKVEFENKFRRNASMCLKSQSAEALIDAVNHLEDYNDISTLLEGERYRRQTKKQRRE